MNIDLLFKDPERNRMALLEIEPLAPLSMVSYMPGSYYRTESRPTKNHLCGLLENILGWHIGEKDRKKILKQMQKVVKKTFNREIESTAAASGYLPLIAHLFNLENEGLFKPHLTYFDDLWTQLLYRDGYSHPKGTMNLSFEIIPLKNQLPSAQEGSVSNDDIGNFFKEYADRYPYFYSAPRVREYIDVHGSFQFKLSINEYLLQALQTVLATDNLGYLGTSEGWVHTKIQEL